MATSFDAVIDLALNTIDDYKLGKLYNQSKEGFKKYCDGFLLSAVPNFYRCRQPLDYDAEAREFAADLSSLEISILADLWIIEWFNREYRNSAQIANKLNVASSFTSHSAAQNLKEKVSTIQWLRESVDKKISKYLVSTGLPTIIT